MGSTGFPSEYLMTCSEPAIESYELSRLNRAALLRKEIWKLIDQWVECEAEARLACWLRQSRSAQASVQGASPSDSESPLPQQLALPLFAPHAAEARAYRTAKPREQPPTAAVAEKNESSASGTRLPAASRGRTDMHASNVGGSTQVLVLQREWHGAAKRRDVRTAADCLGAQQRLRQRTLALCRPAARTRFPARQARPCCGSRFDRAPSGASQNWMNSVQMRPA